MKKNGAEELVALIKRGGVFYDVPGTMPKEVLTNLTGLISPPVFADKKLLLDAVLEREALMPTTVGHGIALPHPRNPLLTDPQAQFVSIAFLKQPVDWKALDGEAVHTMILIVSASAKLHLDTLSKINFFCQQDSFRSLMQGRASREEIMRVIGEAERAWT
ncbi:MAG: PTS sugar transporter subunit IIA [Spirochaetaceae bacterium]|jgi:PTS system nitrogen regulatory IIA component|nr:PTS sugar transporter subunit IIA [Spirochaetaceae bacterium]